VDPLISRECRGDAEVGNQMNPVRSATGCCKCRSAIVAVSGEEERADVPSQRQRQSMQRRRAAAEAPPKDTDGCVPQVAARGRR
jgi:acyl-CoA hydrolase